MHVLVGHVVGASAGGTSATPAAAAGGASAVASMTDAALQAAAVTALRAAFPDASAVVPVRASVVRSEAGVTFLGRDAGEEGLPAAAAPLKRCLLFAGAQRARLPACIPVYHMTTVTGRVGGCRVCVRLCGAIRGWWRTHARAHTHARIHTHTYVCARRRAHRPCPPPGHPSGCAAFWCSRGSTRGQAGGARPDRGPGGGCGGATPEACGSPPDGVCRCKTMHGARRWLCIEGCGLMQNEGRG